MPGGGGRGRRTGNPFLAIAHFVRDVRSELRKVAWPTQRETVNLTVVVIALSVAMGIFLGGADYLFQSLFGWLIKLAGGGSA
jgi:preprotein translocase subunit SecE